MSQADDDRTTILLIKGAISELEPEQRAEVGKLIIDLKALRRDHPDTFGIAFALVGAEMQAEP
jgi:hypothetical protein